MRHKSKEPYATPDKAEALIRCSCWRKCDHTECGHKTPHKRFRKSKWGDCPRDFCGHVGHYVTCTPNASREFPAASAGKLDGVVGLRGAYEKKLEIVVAYAKALA